MTKLGMVIINYNDYKTTEVLLNNVKDYESLDSIVVVDNHSTDNSYKILKKLENKKIVVIEAEENKGYAAGLNIGAKYLNKKYKDCNIIFSNSDIIINKSEDLQKLSDDIKDDIAVVGPTIVQKNEITKKNELSRGWMMPTIKDEIKFNLPLISRKYRKEILYYNDYYKDDLSLVGVVSGCIFCVSGKALKEINYFDEGTFLYYEEQILSKKLEEIDKRVVVDNNVVVVHNHSVTIDKNIKRINKYKTQKISQEYFVKNYLHATDKELKWLKFTKNLSLVILYIRCFFKGGLKK